MFGRDRESVWESVWERQSVEKRECGRERRWEECVGERVWERKRECVWERESVEGKFGGRRGLVGKWGAGMRVSG